MNQYSVDLGKYLTTRRMFLHIKVSDIVSTIGYNRISYYYFESGKQTFPIATLPTICNLLKINIDDALYLKSKPSEFVSNSEINTLTISNNLRNIRKKNKLTQIELANKLHVDKKTVHNYESIKMPNLIFIKKFCDLFEILPSEVFY